MPDFVTENMWNKVLKKKDIAALVDHVYKQGGLQTTASFLDKLKNLGLINTNNGCITLTENGLKKSTHLYHRHQVLELFLKDLNKEEFKLEQVEKLEHFIDDVTLKNIESLIQSNNQSKQEQE